jgi:peroxidase
MQTNGPSFQVPTGRRDGLSSNIRDADVLPDVSDSIQVLRSKFAASGLNDRDLVLLTAAHTIGTTACFFVKDRLYGYRGGAGSDPSIPPAFLSELKARCAPGDFNTRVPLDRGSEGSFDDSIYRNIRAGLVPIASDAALEASNATAALIASYLGAASASLAQDFVGAMVKMGTIGAITGDAGEVRDVCTAFNDNQGRSQEFDTRGANSSLHKLEGAI